MIRKNLNQAVIGAFFLAPLVCSTMTGRLSVSEQTVSSLADYTYEIEVDTKISDQNGYIDLVFNDVDDGFDIRQASDTFGVGGTVECNALYGFATPNDLVCTVETETTVRLTGGFPITENFIMFRLLNVQNPSFVSSVFTEVTSYDASGNVLDESGSTIFGITYEPSLLGTEIVTVPLDSQTVGEYVDVLITFTPAHDLSNNSVFYLESLKWNRGTRITSLAQSFWITTNLEGVRDGSSTTYNIGCQNEDHLDLDCVVTINRPSDESEIATITDVLTVSGFSTAIGAGEPLTITTRNNRFRNPPSTRPITTFKSSTYDSNGLKVGQRKTGIIYQGDSLSQNNLQVRPLDASQVTITPGSYEISEQTQLEFSVTLDLPLPVGALFKIGIPSDIQLFEDGSNDAYLDSVVGSEPIWLTPQMLITDEVQADEDVQVVKVSGVVPTYDNYVNEGNAIKFRLSDIVNPEATGATAPFTIRVYDQENYMISEVVDNDALFYQASVGELDEVTIEVKNTKTREKNEDYTFSFITKNDLVVGGSVSIQIPNDIGIDSSQLTFSRVNTIEAGLVPRYEESTRTIWLDNAFLTAWPAPVKVEFIMTGFENAPSEEPTGTFLISTLNEQNEAIDKGESQNLQFVANEIKAIEATACVDIQDKISETGDICTYSLRFIVGSDYAIESGSSITVVLPVDLTLDYEDSPTEWNSNYAHLSSTNGIADLSTEFARVVNSQKVTVLNAFNQNSAPNGVDWAQDTFEVNIAGIVSPRTTAPTLSFKVYIEGPNNYPEYKKEQGVYANVAQGRAFNRAIIRRSNEVNGINEGHYNFTVSLSSRVYKNEYIKITPPEGIELIPTSEQCLGFEPLADLLACSHDRDSLYVRLMPEDADQEFFEKDSELLFQVKRYQNPDSFMLTDSFKLYATTGIEYDYQVNSITQGLSIQNTIEGSMTNVQVLPAPQTLGQNANYAFFVTLANDMTENGYVEIEFPWDIVPDNVRCRTILSDTMNDPNCTVEQEIIPSADGGDPSIISIVTMSDTFETKVPSAGDELGFSLENIQNPTQSITPDVVAESFKIRTMSDLGNAIDRAHNLDFTIGCVYPCLSCEEDLTKCTSCQSVDGIPLSLHQDKCLTECPPNYYSDGNYDCQPCTGSCKTCNTDPNFCDSCLDGLLLVPDEGRCVDSCAAYPGSFKSEATQSCEKCDDTCESCANTSECLTCKVGTYFYLGQCLSECPETSVKLRSDLSNACTLCETPCFTCEGDVNTCTSCVTGMFFFPEDNTCLEECPPTYLPDDFGTCLLASEPTAPFITLIFTGIILILIVMSLICDNQKFKKSGFEEKGDPSDKNYNWTRPFSAFLALQASAHVVFWFYWLIFLAKDNHKASSTLMTIALVNNYIINCIWYNYYKDRILTEDAEYRDYKLRHPKTQKCIVVLSVLTNFQLFRLSYSKLFNSDRYGANFSTRLKFYKRMNRYTLFQITFCYTVSLFAGGYNLFYTWNGRQVFWIDIENIIVSTLMIMTMVIVILKTQKIYAAHDPTKLMRQKVKYQVEVGQTAGALANEIHDLGVLDRKLAAKVSQLSKVEQRGVFQDMFSKIFYGNKNKQAPQTGALTGHVAHDQHIDFIVKHGLDQELDEKHEDPKSQLKGVHIGLKPYQSNKVVTKAHARKASQQSFDGNTYERANNTLENTQNATQLLDNTAEQTIDNYGVSEGDVLRTTTQMNDLSADLPLASDRQKELVLKNKKTADLEEEPFYEDPLKFSFMSAPYDADSAVRGNDALKARHEKFMELYPLKKGAKMQIQSQDSDNQPQIISTGVQGMGNSRNMPKLKDDTHLTKRVASTSQGMRAGPVFAQEPYQSSSKRGSSALNGKANAGKAKYRGKSQESIRGSVRGSIRGSARGSQLGSIQIDQASTTSQPDLGSVVELELYHDSDDEIENFASNEWGAGTSKVVAQHYNTLHNRKFTPSLKMTPRDSNRRGSVDDDQLKERQEYNKLNAEDFKKIHEELKAAREAKLNAKGEATRYVNDIQTKEKALKAEEKENDRLRALMDDLKKRIEAQMSILKAAQLKKQQDLAFIENANYTSNEEAMGVSPNSYVVANRMPGQAVNPLASPVKEVLGGESSQGAHLSTEERKGGPTVMPNLRTLHGKRNTEHQNTDGQATVVRNIPGSSSKPRVSSRARTRSQTGARNMNATDGFRNSQDGLSGRARSNNGSRSGLGGTNTSNNFAKVVPYVSDVGSNSGTNGRKKSSRQRLANVPLLDEKDEFQYYTSEDENGNKVQKLRKVRKEVNTEAKKLKKPRSRGRINKQMNAARNSTEELMTTSQDDRVGFPKIKRNAGNSQTRDGSSNGGNSYRQRSENRIRTTTLRSHQEENFTPRRAISRDANRTQAFEEQDSRDIAGVEARKKKKKVKRQAPKDFSGVYFNHTNFERAVIATNGKAPYNNKEVEVISRREGFDPGQFNFKNNWVNKIDKNLGATNATNISAQGSALRNIKRDGSNNRYDDSSSMQATTVFQGQVPQGYMGSEFRGAPSYQALPETPPVQTAFPGLAVGGAEVNQSIDDINTGSTPQRESGAPQINESTMMQAQAQETNQTQDEAQNSINGFQDQQNSDHQSQQ